LERTLQALTLSAVAVSLYGVYQYVSGASGASAWVDSTMFTGISTRVYSTLENPNVLAGYLLLATPFVFALAITGEGQLTRIFYALCGAILLLCMVLTYARGGWLGLIVAAAVMLVFIDRRFILVGAVGLVALYFLTPQVILDRFLSIGDLSDGSTSYRLTIWLGTLSMLRDYWYSGIGPGVAAFNQVYPLYSYNTAVAQHSHNLFLQIMCDSGIVGLLTFSALLFTAFRLIAGTIRRLNVTHARRPASFYYLAAGAASLSGFLVQGMADYSFYNYRVTFVFWAILGIVAAACRLAISKDGER
ncbi:MAG: O-antigen ligase family protein, partial [Oscillospiraceae bacterium]|nr:O-antigen ligase family protein [Oscillospiraceae bacterium]